MSSLTYKDSYESGASLSNTDADSYVRSKISKFDWSDFRFGSTYPFLTTSLSTLGADLDTLKIGKNKSSIKFKVVLKKLVKSTRPALKRLKSIEYDKYNKIDTDIWDRLVSRQREVTCVSEDSLNFMIKWCELCRHRISFISSYDIKVLMDEQESLKNGEFADKRPYLYSDIVNKFSSKTIIFPFNKGKNHWVVYMVMNHHNSNLINTDVEEDYPSDLREEEFPCIICFDSSNFTSLENLPPMVDVADNKFVIGDKVSLFLNMFLNHIRETNIFNHYTLPLFYAKCQSQSGMSCGYHAMMNMFTLTKFSGEYIPIKFEETGLSMDSLLSYVNNDENGGNINFPNNIFFEREQKDNFRFGLHYQRNLKTFCSNLETLISRMNYLYYIIDIERKEGKKLERLFENAQNNKRWSSGQFSKHEEKAKMVEIIQHEFLRFYISVNLKPTNKCQCEKKIPNAIKKYCTERLHCHRFKQPVKYLPRELDAKCFEMGEGVFKPLYYHALINNCQLCPTNVIPDGGNCGLCAFSLVLRDNYDHILKLDDLRRNVGVDPLFRYREVSRTNTVIDETQKRIFVKNFDWMSYLRLHYAEMLDENSSVIENLLNSDSRITKLRDTYKFDKKYTAHPRKGVQSTTSEYNILKDYYMDDTRSDELFADYNPLYCKSVARYCLELCLFQEKLDLKIVVKAIKRYISLNPKDVGKFGCYWIDSCAIDWFDETFLVKTIILKCTENSWIRHPFSINGVPDGEENLFYDMSYCKENNRFIPYGFYIMVHDGNHFESLIMCEPFKSTFFPMGKVLPDILYKHLNIDKRKWEKMDLDEVHKFNLDMMRIKEEGNYLKKLPTIWSTENYSIIEQPFPFASSMPSQDFRFSPLRLAWDCVKESVSEKDSSFNKDIYKDYVKNKNWGVLEPKISSEVFAISLCRDLKQTFYDHHIRWHDLKKIVKEDEKIKFPLVRKSIVNTNEDSRALEKKNKSSQKIVLLDTNKKDALTGESKIGNVSPGTVGLPKDVELPEVVLASSIEPPSGIVAEYDNTNVNEMRTDTTRKVRQKTRSAGYFYIPTKEKTTGTVRSCVHDAISIALSRFNVLGIKEKLYEKFPPLVEKDTEISPLLESDIVSNYVRFVEINLSKLGKGGPLLWLLCEENLKSGVYLLYCKTTYYCRSTKKNIYQHHTIVYDSNYECRWHGRVLKGALIDNRKGQYLIALEKNDRSSKEQCRRTLDRWFLGYETKVRCLFKAFPNCPLEYFGEPNSLDQKNVLEFENIINEKKIKYRYHQRKMLLIKNQTKLAKEI